MAEPVSSPVSSAAPVTSTPAPASTPAPSAPTSTADIAADVIADLEGSSNDNTPPIPATPAPVPVAATPTTDPDDLDTIPTDIVDSLGRKRINSIPLPRVKEMRTKDQQKLLTTLAKELGMTPAEGAALKLEDVVGIIKEHGTKRTGYEARLQQVDAVEKLIAENHDRFMEIISEINPRFKEYTKKDTVTAPVQPVVVEDPEPQPDYDLGEGKMTYSLEGLKKRDAWKEQQIIKKIEAQLADRFKPVEDRFKADKEREEYNQWHTEATQRVTQRLEKARKWPKFADHESAILNAMQADQSVSLEDAYMQIVVPGLAGDRTKIRQEVLAEIEAQPKTSSVTATPTAVKASDKPKSTADIAKEVIASMGV